jgi:hypothetical protein
MPCPTGLNAAFYLQATDPVAPDDLDDILGDLWENVKDASNSFEVALADLSSRASRFRKNCPTLVNLTIELEIQYERDDEIFEAVREAVIDGTPVDVTMLDSKAGLYEGIVGRFHVASQGIQQPLEEGQTVTISLSVLEWGEWLTGDHDAE